MGKRLGYEIRDRKCDFPLPVLQKGKETLTMVSIVDLISPPKEPPKQEAKEEQKPATISHLTAEEEAELAELMDDDN